MEIVRDINLLKRMAKKGLIKLHNQTGSKIKGLYSNEKFTCTYIDEAPICFDFEGETYGQIYLSGCFNPFLQILKK